MSSEDLKSQEQDLEKKQVEVVDTCAEAPAESQSDPFLVTLDAGDDPQLAPVLKRWITVLSRCR
ncbi:hypothetical protein FIBSPDRAFT_969709 [Athelia psychrophila]|uniref:Uncharacterized protein n=1 Tax=Athelia psychrophila TaxID=1759441 RepID=A0A167T8Z2_9AGAM|nr:hypothetical protein FIBSPDRAFT_969709 [Fibularhizoctonia sp. CBS 109695]